MSDMAIVHASEELAEDDVQPIMDALVNQSLIVIPTDTVYGIATTPYSPAAVQKLLDAKGRGRAMPPPVLVAQAEQAQQVSAELNDTAQRLIESFCPGALTLITKAAPTVQWDLGDIKGTIALRMPNHPVALNVLRHTGPLAVSSANLSGQPPATNVDQAVNYFHDDVTFYIDGGPTPGLTASTILDVTQTQPVLIRKGVISVEDIEDVSGRTVRTR